MDDAARIFACLADPVRLAALALLQRHGELSVGDVQHILGLTQSRASRHLAALRRAGFAVARRAGTSAYYAVPRWPERRQRLVLDDLAELIGRPALDDLAVRYRAWASK